MKLIENAHRKTKLIKAGVPSRFFTLLDEAEDYPELDIKHPEGAYFYLPTMHQYETFDNFSVVPICDIGSGDSFLLYLFNDTEQKFIYLAIESDEILEDYGTNIMSMLANLLIDSYDFLMDELYEVEASKEEFTETLEHLVIVGNNLGIDIKHSQQIIDRLYKADEEKEERFEGETKWIKENIHSIFE